MTVSSSVNKVIYSGNSATVLFPVNYYFLENSHLKVILRAADGTETVQALTTNYTVTGAGNPAGGSITMLVAPPTTTTLTIVRNVPATQETDYLANDPFPAESHERALDKLTMLTQENEEIGSRSIQIPQTDPVSTNTIVPKVSDRASKLLGFGSAGSVAVSSSTIAQVDAAVATITSIASAPSGNSAGISHIAAGSGAVTTTVQAKLRETVSVLDYGADPTGVNDSATAIQAAIDYAVNTSKQAVYIPAGRYRIDKTLQLGSGTSFRSVYLYGDGKTYRGESQFTGTTIYSTFSNAPMIAVNAGRGTTIAKLSLKGLNYNWIQTKALGTLTPLLDDLVISNWVDPALDANANSRYAPYCAIAIDPYSGSIPSPAYPDNTYGKASSSETNIEDVQITGFVVGVAIKPSDDNNNADYTRLTNCTIDFCVYAVSVGNTQSRLVGLTNTNIIQVHTGLTTKVHGKQTGRGSFTVLNCEFGNIIKWIDATSSLGGPCTFTGCYGEVTYSIGTYSTTGASSEPIVFTGCTLNFGGQESRGVPKYILDATSTDVICNGLSLQGLIGTANFSGKLMLNDVNVQASGSSPNSGTVPLFRAFAYNATGGVTTSNIVYDGGPSAFIRVNGGKNLTTGADAGSLQILGMNQPTSRATALSLWSKTMAPSGSTAVLNARAGSASSVFASTAFSISQTGNEVTLVKTSSLTADNYNYFGMNPGDIVRHDATNTIFYIRSRSTDTIIMVAQNNYNGSNVLLETITGGNFYFYCSRLYGSSVTLLGTATSGSPTFTTVGQSDGGTSNDVVADDALFIEQKFNYLLNPAHTVTTVNTGAGTMTFSVNAAKSGTFNLGPFIRKAPPNV